MLTKKERIEAKIRSSLLPKLANLGLTRQEAQIYLILNEVGPMSAKEIAKNIKIFTPSVYRIIKKLEKKRLVAIFKTIPFTFQSIPPPLALSAYAKEKAIFLQKEAEETAKLFLSKETTTTNPTKINLIFGRHELFSKATEMINTLKKELLIISIGEPLPQDLLLAVNHAHKRGVIVQMITHKYNQENKEVLENFKKNGYIIRHYPDSGFHLIIYDGKQAMLAVNNPEKLEERVTMQIFSPGLSKALRDYFYSIWKKATHV